MSSPLDGCWAKIERANENINSLGVEIEAFTGSSNYRVVRDVKDEAREYIFRVFGPNEPLPLRFAVLTGEIVHHLRSTLDHLLWALVRGAPPKGFRAYFPIKTDAKKFIDARKALKQHIPASALDIVERCQPYDIGGFLYTHNPDDHALKILHDLDVTDKHKLLVVASVYVARPDSISFIGPTKMADIRFVECKPTLTDYRAVRPTEDGAEIVRVRLLPGMPSNVDVKAKIPIEIAFEKFGVQGIKPIIPGLVELRDAVVKTIKLFAREF